VHDTKPATLIWLPLAKHLMKYVLQINYSTGQLYLMKFYQKNFTVSSWEKNSFFKLLLLLLLFSSLLLLSHLTLKIMIMLHEAIIFSVALYGCETLSLTSVWKQCSGKHLRPKKDELRGQFRMLHNKKLCDLHITPSIGRIVKIYNTMGWLCS